MLLRPHRSALFIPGANARALEKARHLAADSLIFDLEDAVAPTAKQLARDQIICAVKQGGYGRREIVIRVNALDTPWGCDDIAAVANCGADAILFPKVESPQQLQAAVKALDNAGAPTTLAIWMMAETPRAVLDIDTIAGAHPRLDMIVMGTSDLTRDMRARHTRERTGLIAALSMCILAARAHKLDILDGVYLTLNDAEGFHAVCLQGRDMGFDGKTLIHPQQIATANTVFAPSAEDAESAHRIIQAWEQARKDNKSVVVVDGKLVENLHVEEAHRTLALLAAIDAMAD